MLSVNAASNVELYSLYKDKCSAEIADIIRAKQNGISEAENKITETLLDSLYLSYGLKDSAHKTFKSTTLGEIQDISEEILGQDWFFVGKNYYIDGFGEDLKNSLLVIDNSQRATLDSAYQSEQLETVSKICMRNHRYGDVLQMLELFPDNSNWKPYAKFNLGVNLLKNNRLDEGRDLLESVANMSTSEEDLDVLRDQANLALAVSHMKSGETDLAVEYFEEIKLGNPQSNSALLGLGWVKFKQLLYDDALRAWLELSKRSKSDPDVHEGLMLAPYALEKRGYKLEALAQYNFAIESFEKQLKNIEVIKSRIKQGGISDILRASANSEANYDLRSAISTMGSELSDGLYDVMVSSEFTRIAKTYRELAELNNNLSKWNQRIPKLADIADEEENAYNYRLGTVVNRLKFDYARKLRDRQAKLVEQFERKK